MRVDERVLVDRDGIFHWTTSGPGKTRIPWCRARGVFKIEWASEARALKLPQCKECRKVMENAKVRVYAR